MITVDVDDVTALLIGGEWFNVHSVSVDFAEYVVTSGARHARGPHLEAVIRGGPHNGDTLVIPLGRVDAVRV